jgi:two-component system sensor histidine kinase KdpD
MSEDRQIEVNANRSTSDLPSPQPDHILVALSGSAGSERLVMAGKRLAEAFGTPWEVIHIETPGDGGAGTGAAEMLGLAARNGATIATVPAATVIDGIQSHLDIAPAKHVVLGAGSTTWVARLFRGSIFDALAARRDGLVLHVHTHDPATEEAGRSVRSTAPPAGPPPVSYAYALAFVAGTLLVAGVLQHFTGPRSLDLLFLFPVIAIAAWLGLRPALLAAALSVVSYNYFLLVPAFSFDVRAPQNLVMAAVLVAAAAYTSVVTSRMRGRMRLSDRSARENASVAALAQRLTRDSDWESTALTICEHVHSLLNVRTVMFREIDGSLEVAAAVPPDVSLGPVDRAALEWVWTNGGQAGAGTEMLSACDWQFQPLETSLGMLAALGLARDDGRDPVRPDQRILLATLVAQAALAHERLRLEDLMRLAPPPAFHDVAR